MAEEYDGHDQESTPEQIEQAISQGWHDDPEHPKYKSAAAFLEVGEKIAPIAAKHNKRLEAKIADMESKYNSLKGDIFKQEQKGYERAINALRTRKEEAFENEDIDELKKIDKEASSLEPPKVEPPPEEMNPADQAEFLAWRASNPWYMNTTDPDDMARSAYADAILQATTAEVQREKGEFVTNTDVLEAVGAKVAERFDGKAKAKPVAQVEGDSGGKGKRTTKKDWRNLPKHIKDQAKEGRYVEKYFEGDREAYAKSAYESIPELQGEK